MVVPLNQSATYLFSVEQVIKLAFWGASPIFQPAKGPGVCHPDAEVLSYSIRNASTGFSRLARRAGNKHASKAAMARTMAVVVSRTGL